MIKSTEQDGIQFLVNERDKVYFENTKMGYVKTLFGGRHFKKLLINDYSFLENFIISLQTTVILILTTF